MTYRQTTVRSIMRHLYKELTVKIEAAERRCRSGQDVFTEHELMAMMEERQNALSEALGWLDNLDKPIDALSYPAHMEIMMATAMIYHPDLNNYNQSSKGD